MMDEHLHSDEERRLDSRAPIRRRCKVFEPRSRRYVAASTCNASANGMLLRLDRRLALEPGDRLFVGAAPASRPGLIHGDDMVETRVTRVFDAGAGEMLIGVNARELPDGLMMPTRRAA